MRRRPAASDYWPALVKAISSLTIAALERAQKRRANARANGRVGAAGNLEIKSWVLGFGAGATILEPDGYGARSRTRSRR